MEEIKKLTLAILYTEKAMSHKRADYGLPNGMNFSTIRAEGENRVWECFHAIQLVESRTA